MKKKEVQRILAVRRKLKICKNCWKLEYHKTFDKKCIQCLFYDSLSPKQKLQYEYSTFVTL